jgi:3-oxoacyl-[acyl-carrier protein] reductase
MNLELADKRVLVTGSSRGIGLAIAQTLQAEGCRVALNGRHADALADAQRMVPGAVVCPGDMTSPEQAQVVVREAVQQLGALDILVCNIGSGQSVAAGEETADEWQRVFAINLWSATNSVDAARTTLAETSGSIVCISSICGLESIPGAPATYSVAKAALNAYVQSMARPLSQNNIRINAIAPGNVVFEGSTWSNRQHEDPDGTRRMLATEVPAGRFAYAEEIASAVAFIASPKASFATGATWVLDGGQTRGGA